MIITPITTSIVEGISELEPTVHGVRPHRLPTWVRQQFPENQLLSMEVQPAGARLRFTTTATRIELVTHPAYVAYQGIERPRGILDLYVNGELLQRDQLTGGDSIVVDLQTGQMTAETGPSHVLTISDLEPQRKTVEIWLPHNEGIDPDAYWVDGDTGWLPHNEGIELIELRSDQPLAAEATERPRWIHHGSSISQGSNAAAPSETWPTIVARHAGVDLVNLGFGGSSLMDPIMARLIRDMEADVVSLKFGINIVNLDGMRRRVFIPALHGFLDTIRDGHPDTPILLMSPLYCGIHEDTPGPGNFDPSTFTTGQARFMATGTPGDTALGRLTLQVVRQAMREVADNRSDDPNLLYLEGTDLYGQVDADTLPLSDNLHPSTEGHQLIGARFAEHALAPGGLFEGLR